MIFAEAPVEFGREERSKIIIQPVPYDGTSTWMKGADKGPNAIIEASQALELYDIETDSEVYKNGIHIATPRLDLSDPARMVQSVKQATKKWLEKDKFVVTLGGEHSITAGIVPAYREKYDDLSVLQLDAHADLRDEYQGSRYNHACVMARVKEVCPLVQVGIRSMTSAEKWKTDDKKLFLASDLVKDPGIFKKIPRLLTRNVYLTIDLDVFDPSIMPSTGTPEPGGLGWYEVLQFVKDLSQKVNIVGMDVVELCPDGRNKAPDFLAAKLIYKILSYIFV